MNGTELDDAAVRGHHGMGERDGEVVRRREVGRSEHREDARYFVAAFFRRRRGNEDDDRDTERVFHDPARDRRMRDARQTVPTLRPHDDEIGVVFAGSGEEPRRRITPGGFDCIAGASDTGQNTDLQAKGSFEVGHDHGIGRRQIAGRRQPETELLLGRPVEAQEGHVASHPRAQPADELHSPRAGGTPVDRSHDPERSFVGPLATESFDAGGNDQYRSIGAANHPLGGAAEEESRERRAAVRSHDDQVRSDLLGAGQQSRFDAAVARNQARSPRASSASFALRPSPISCSKTPMSTVNARRSALGLAAT